jgi:hypothetical protein
MKISRWDSRNVLLHLRAIRVSTVWTQAVSLHCIIHCMSDLSKVELDAPEPELEASILGVVAPCQAHLFKY